MAEEQDCPVSIFDPKAPLRDLWSEGRISNRVVNAKRNDSDASVRYTKALDELFFHRGRMNENVVGQAILNSQCEAIEDRVVRIPLGRINVMCGEGDLLPLQFVIEHQQGSIEGVKLIVPQDMEDRRLRARRVSDKSRIVGHHTPYLGGETGIWLLTASQIEKSEVLARMEFRAVHLVATNEIQAHAFRTERHSQSECVRLVNASGEQSD